MNAEIKKEESNTYHAFMTQEISIQYQSTWQKWVQIAEFNPSIVFYAYTKTVLNFL